MQWDVLSTREWATVTWAAIVLFVCLIVPSVRSGIGRIVGLVVSSWRLQLVALAFLAWTAGVLSIGHMIGVWNWGLLKDSIAWVLVSGIATIGAALKAPKQDQFFRRAFISAFRLTVLMQFLLNLHTFHFSVELVLQPIVTLLIAVGIVAESKPDTLPAKKLTDGLLSLIGVWVIIQTVQGILRYWQEVDQRQTGLAFALSIWLPLAMLPFVYLLAVVTTHGRILKLTALQNKGRKPPLAVKAALLVGLNGDLRAVNDLPHHQKHYQAISRSGSFSQASRHVRDYEQQRRRSIEEARIAAARFHWYSGNKGRRADGTLLDQREFKETRDALRWFAHLPHGSLPKPRTVPHRHTGHHR